MDNQILIPLYAHSIFRLSLYDYPYPTHFTITGRLKESLLETNNKEAEFRIRMGLQLLQMSGGDIRKPYSLSLQYANGEDFISNILTFKITQ